MKQIYEFDKPNTQNVKTVTKIAKSANFDISDATDISGLVIAPNGMVAVEYDLNKDQVIIRPDNDLKLNDQNISQFESDFKACKALISAIYNI